MIVYDQKDFLGPAAFSRPSRARAENLYHLRQLLATSPNTLANSGTEHIPDTSADYQSGHCQFGMTLSVSMMRTCSGLDDANQHPRNDTCRGMLFSERLLSSTVWTQRAILVADLRFRSFCQATRMRTKTRTSLRTRCTRARPSISQILDALTSLKNIISHITSSTVTTTDEWKGFQTRT